jgi:type II secretory pathway component GspD/PulD (secretin)
MINRFARSLSGLGALVLASTVWGAGHIDSVTGKAVGDQGATISIVGHDLSAPVASHVGRLFIWQFDASMQGPNKKFDVGAGGVDSARMVWFSHNPATLRLAVHVDGTSQPTLEKTADGYCVYFGSAKPTVSAPKPPVETHYSAAQEMFPETVPPLTAPKPVVTAQTAAAMTSVVSKQMSARVSLDFVNTEVVQILKALAMQANVNIVTSPDVVGKLTVSLGSVPLSQALDFVTAMAGVRYTRVGDTYVVASPGKFSDTVQNLFGNVDLATATRVVPIYSHQGNQVKAAVLKSLPVSTLEGKYDLLLSNEEIGITQETKVPSGAGAGDPNGAKVDGGGPKNDTVVSSKTTHNSSKNDVDNYMMIVGTPGRLAQVEMAARTIDASICQTMGIRIPESNGVMQRTYEPRGVAAEDLVACMKDHVFGDVQLFATPRTSVSRQVIVISGRYNEVSNVYDLLNSMDSLSDGGPAEFEIVGLKFVKPQLAMVDVLDAIPGIRAKLLPASVEPNVGLAYTDSARTSSQNNGQASPNMPGGANGGAAGAAGGQTPASNGGASGGASGASGSGGGSSSGGNTGVGTAPTTKNEGVTDTTATVATFSTPMKLLLKGSPQQIADAKKFLAMIDVAPKQVAIELRVMELSNDDALNIGLNLSALTGGTLQSLVVNEALGDASTAGGVSTKLGFKGGGSLGAIGTLDSITTKNNLIARPSVLASDGALTHIFVGDEVRYVESVQVAANTGTSVQTAEVNVGVDFYVTARIGAEGHITLDLRPTFSILEGFTDVPGGGKLPQTSSRTAETIVNIRSGETIAIGGLIQTQDVKNYSGIPILKDLPIIGRLFGRTSNDKVRKEVVFFITTREVTENDRQGAANPKQAEKDNTTWPGGGPKKGG